MNTYHLLAYIYWLIDICWNSVWKLKYDNLIHKHSRQSALKFFKSHKLDTINITNHDTSIANYTYSRKSSTNILVLKKSKDIVECHRRLKTNCSYTWHEEDSPPSNRPSPTTRTQWHSPTHTAMFKKCFGDMCTPYRKKITSNQDRVGCVQALLIWRGLEGVTCVYGIRNGRHSNTMLPCQGMFMGESFFPILSFV